MKEDILFWISELKKTWGKLTIIGKIVLFPLVLIIMTFFGVISLMFIAMEECWAGFKRVNTKIFLKP